MTQLRAPFPWYGGKSRAAPLIWRAFGNVPNYVEPFAGGLGVLLGRPHAPKVETVNDKDGLICNFWRAVAAAPRDVAQHSDWPVNEADLHARHQWLVNNLDNLTERLIADPKYYDALIAGWWVWGISCWVGSGWCQPLKSHWRAIPKIGAPGIGVNARANRTTSRKRPMLPANLPGKGVNGPTKRKPRTDRNHGVHVAPADIFDLLCERLRDVRVCCGEWYRVLGRSTLGVQVRHGTTPCAVLLDPPYAHDNRDTRLYREDDATLSSLVRAWAIEHGPNPELRIALCGLEGEHEMPDGWTVCEWKKTAPDKDKSLERVWLSPHCLPVDVQLGLFSAEVH